MLWSRISSSINCFHLSESYVTAVRNSTISNHNNHYYREIEGAINELRDWKLIDLSNNFLYANTQECHEQDIFLVFQIPTLLQRFGTSTNETQKHCT